MNCQKSQFFAAMVLTILTASNVWATNIPVTGELDCSTGTECVISGVGSNPLFSGSANTGDVIDITFAGNKWFQPILDDVTAEPWEVTMSGKGTNSGDNVGIGIYLSDINGDPVTGSAGLSLNNFLLGFGDGVSFLSLPTFVYDFHIEIRQWELVDVTRTFTLDQVKVVDRADEGPVITFRVDGEAIPGTPIPEPATMLLLGTGLVGVAGAARRGRKRIKRIISPLYHLHN